MSERLLSLLLGISAVAPTPLVGQDRDLTLWVTLGDSDQLVEVDPWTYGEIRRIKVDPRPHGLAVSADSTGDETLFEGMAPYLAALWQDQAGSGGRKLAETMREAADSALGSDGGAWRGAWTLHELRGVMGDSAFARGLAAIYREYRDRTAGLADVSRAMSQAAGRDVDWVLRQDRGQVVSQVGDLDHVVRLVADPGVAFARHGDHLALARAHLLEVRDHLVIDRAPVRDHQHRHALVDQRDGPVLHLAGGVALGVDVGDFLELEGAFQRDREHDAPAQEQEVAGAEVFLCDAAHALVELERPLEEARQPE